MSLKPKDLVQRSIDGEWFEAVIEKINRDRRTVAVRYTDDDNYESDVPIEEVRRSSNEENKRYNANTQFKRIPGDTLPRPLAGLVDDDHEERRNHMPTVFVHDDTSINEAIIMNGAENKLAAGGGLRALRYLKS